MFETRLAAERSKIQLIEIEVGYDIDRVADLRRALDDLTGEAPRTVESIRLALATIDRDV